MDWQRWEQPALGAPDRVLAGKRVLITRSADQSTALERAILDLGGRPILFPVIVILPPESWSALDHALTRLSTYQWLVLTSQNGVTALGQRLAALDLALADFPALRVAVVGTSTKGVLATLGRSPDLVPLEFRGTALHEALAPLLRHGDRLLLPRGDRADHELPKQLEDLGVWVDAVVVYRTDRPKVDAAPLLADLATGQIDYVTFTSSTTVENLILLLGGTDPLQRARIACIGPETKKTAEALGLRVEVMAEQATSAALAMAIAKHAQHL